MNCILLRYGEIGTKSWRKRPVFEKLYVEAIKDALDREGFSDYIIKNLGGRFIIRHNEPERMVELLKRVPGIQSLSIGHSFVFKKKEDIVSEALGFSKGIISGKTFKVSTKRTGKHDFSSMEVSRLVGDSIYSLSKGVDMKDPEVMINIEIRGQEAFIFTKSHEGMGGLPPKSAGKALMLFSGGIDSPVAAYKAISRGFALDFLYVNLLGEKGSYETAQVYNYLASMYCFGYRPRLFIVDGISIVKRIKNDVDGRLRQIALKIAIYKIGEKIARNNSICALVTGEALSQKSSQTVESLGVIESQVDILVLRPLIFTDKIEIIRTAREIGTFSYSEKVSEFCNISEGPVSTIPKMDVIRFMPDLSVEIDRAVKSATCHKGLCTIEPEKEPKLDFKDFSVVDISSGFLKGQKIDYDIKKKYPEVLDEIDDENIFPRDKNYIVVCDFGVKAENLAYSLRKRKINAIGMSIRTFKENIRKD